MTENRIKISNPERITRILRKISEANLQVFLRTADEKSIAVRGKASNVVKTVNNMNESVVSLRISNLSEKGMKYLINLNLIQVEFIMMSTKVMFVTNVISKDQSSIYLEMPTSLISIERRKNARFPTTVDLSAFISLSIWRAESEDYASPPIFTQFTDVASYIPIVDISSNGLCVTTRFPAVNKVIKRGLIDDRALLILPMQKPIKSSVEIRWFKKIKETIKAHDGTFRNIRSYRFGCEFMNPTDEMKVAIQRFIQQLNQAEAI